MSIISFSNKPQKTSTINTFLAYDPYIERFWQPILGPTACGLLNLLALEILINNQHSTSCVELSRRTGTGNREGKASPALKQLKRLGTFGLVKEIAENRYTIYSQIPMLNTNQLSFLTLKERTHHEIWLERITENPLQTQLNKATHLIIIMTMMGYSPGNVEMALNNSGLHPCVIGQLTKFYPISDVS